MSKALHVLHRFTGTVCQSTLKRFIGELKKSAKARLKRYGIIKVSLVESTDDFSEGCYQRVSADDLMMEFEVKPGTRRLTKDQACEVFYAHDFIDIDGLGVVLKSKGVLSIVEKEFVQYVYTMGDLLGKEKLDRYCQAFFGMTAKELSKKHGY